MDERVGWLADVIHDAYDGSPAGIALSVLAAIDKAHAIVPKEPTEDMVGGATALWWLDFDNDEEVRLTVTGEQAKQIYRAMIEAAPTSIQEIDK